MPHQSINTGHDELGDDAFFLAGDWNLDQPDYEMNLGLYEDGIRDCSSYCNTSSPDTLAALHSSDTSFSGGYSADSDALANTQPNVSSPTPQSLSQQSSSRQYGPFERDENDWVPPPYSHQLWVCLQEIGGPQRTARLKEIYEWFRNNTQVGSDKPNCEGGWDNGIRHNLSQNEAFSTARRSWWHISDEAFAKGSPDSTSNFRGVKKTRSKGSTSSSPSPARSRAGARGGAATASMRRSAGTRLAKLRGVRADSVSFSQGRRRQQGQAQSGVAGYPNSAPTSSVSTPASSTVDIAQRYLPNTFPSWNSEDTVQETFRVLTPDLHSIETPEQTMPPYYQSPTMMNLPMNGYNVPFMYAYSHPSGGLSRPSTPMVPASAIQHQQDQSYGVLYNHYRQSLTSSSSLPAQFSSDPYFSDPSSAQAYQYYPSLAMRHLRTGTYTPSTLSQVSTPPPGSTSPHTHIHLQDHIPIDPSLLLPEYADGSLYADTILGDGDVGELNSGEFGMPFGSLADGVGKHELDCGL